MADRELKVIITGDADSLNKAFKSVDKGASSLGKGLKTLGKVAAVGVGAAFAGLAVALKAGFDEVSEGQQVLAQTNAVLKSTGGQANVTAKDVTKLAESLSLMSGADDEAIQASENLLLTFTNVRNEAGKGNDIFNQTTTAVLDMATAMNNGAVPSMEDLNSNTIRIGKALNDPIKGMTALSKVGVSFTEAQKKQVAEMVKAGDVMGAQKLILAELTKEFGGSAKAAGETLPGQLSKLKNSFSEVAGEIFTTLLPYLTQFLDWVNRNMPTIQMVIQTTLDAVVATIEFLGPIIQKVIGWFQQLADFARKHWDQVQAAAEKVVAWYEGTLAPAVENVLAAITAFWERFGGAITKIATVAFNSVWTIVKTVLANIASVVQAFLALLGGDWQQAWDEIKEIPKRTLSAIATIIRGALTIFKTAAIALGNAAMDGLKAGLDAGWKKISTFFSNLPGRIISAVGDLGSTLFSAGYDVIAGFLDGIKQKAEDLWNYVKGIPGRVKDFVTGGFDISSPSKVMINIGKQVAEGLKVGIDIGMVSVEETFADRINQTIDRAVAAVEARKSALADAFGLLASNALTAFDTLSDQMLTRTEKKIAKQDEQRAKADRQKNLQEAQAQLVEAQAGGDPEEIKRAQEAVNEALFQIQRAADEKRAAQERKTLEDRQALRRRHFEEELAALQKQLETGRITQDEAQQKILKLFKKYHIPFKNAAGALGSALAEGLRDSFADVRKATRELANTIADELAKIKIVVDVSIKRSASGKDNNKTPGRALGGPVRQGNLYVVGERGPEFFVPNQSGTIIPNGAAASGGGTYVFNFPNYLGDKRDLERSLQQMMRRFEDNNGISFTGRALA